MLGWAWRNFKFKDVPCNCRDLLGTGGKPQTKSCGEWNIPETLPKGEKQQQLQTEDSRRAGGDALSAHLGWSCSLQRDSLGIDSSSCKSHFTVSAFHEAAKPKVIPVMVHAAPASLASSWSESHAALVDKQPKLVVFSLREMFLLG